MSYPEAVPCVSCGETVSKYALTCPHCGCNHANRLWWLWMKWVFGAVVVVLILIGLGALFKDCSCSSARTVFIPQPFRVEAVILTISLAGLCLVGGLVYLIFDFARKASKSDNDENPKD